MNKVLRLRWCFHYHDNKPSVRGQWFGGEEGAAASVSKENLRCAVAEAQDMRTWEIFPLYECDGQDFIIFQWITLRHLGCFSGPLGFIRLEGLRIISRYQYIEVLRNGEVNIFPVEKPNENFQSLKR